MEIQWGEFYLYMERTVAMIVALVPVVVVMQLPPVARLIGRLMVWLQKRKEKRFPGLFG